MSPDSDETAAAVAGEPALGPFSFAGPGTVVAGYRLRQRIGAGGMGVVYRAEDLALERPVAVKLIQPELALAPSVRDLFVRESLTVARLEHPHIVPIYAAGEANGRLYIAMRLIDGQSFRELLAAGPLAPGRVVRLARQLAAALAAAHRAGVVHRDVKPANILVTGAGSDEHAYLTDFGLSAGGQPGRAGGGAPKGGGTPAYCPPEQARGAPADPRSDIYALSCVLFEALTGHPPFAGDPEQLARAHRAQPPPRLSALAPGLPAGLDAALGRGLAKRPAERFATVQDLADAMAAARHDVLVVHHRNEVASGRRLATALAGEQVQTARLELADATSSDPESEIDVAAGCALVVGAVPAQSWALSLVAAVRRRDLPLVVVLVAGAPAPNDPLLGPLADLPWVDLRVGDPGSAQAARAVGRAVSAGRSGRREAAIASECPYPGLAGFAEDDADFFVGRDADIAAVLAMLATDRFVAVIGASGSGKSSLVRAGIVPRLRSGATPGASWSVARITPGAQPAAALRAGMAALARAGDRRCLLLVDQLEEVFTLCADAAARTQFLDAIADLARDPAGDVSVLITLRADFYPRCAEHPRLRELIAEHQRLLGPLGPADLRRVIEEPATRAGLDLEPGLSTLIMDDAGDDAAALPLISDLLAELWRRRSRRTLTLAAYGESGGVRQALATRADATYAALTPDQQQTARGVLLRLVVPGEGTADARRRLARDELHLAGAGPGDADQVVDTLVAARLLSAGRDPVSGAATIEIAHEALIQGWPRLRAWIERDRDRLRIASRLSDAAREWERAGRDPDLVARGGRLALWREQDPAQRSALEHDFLTRSHETAARARASERRRTRLTIAGLAAAVVVISAVAGLALVQRAEAERQRDLQASDRLVAAAENELQRAPELAVLTALEARRLVPTSRADLMVRRAALLSPLRATAALGGSTTGEGAVGAVALGRTRAILVGNVGMFHWSQTAGEPPRPWADQPVRAVAAAHGPAGPIVTAGPGAVIRTWTAAGRERALERRTMPGGALAFELAIDPRGRWLAAVDDFGLVCRWRLRPAGDRRCVTTASRDARVAVDFGGRTLIVSAAGALVWDLAGQPRALSRNAVGPRPEAYAAFGGSDRGGLFVWLARGELWRWRPGRDPEPRRLRLPGVTGRVTAVGLDGRARVVAVATRDTGGAVQVDLWRLDPAGRAVVRAFGPLRHHVFAVRRLAFSADGSRVLTMDGLRGVASWDWSQAIAQHRPLVRGVAPGGLSWRSADRRFVVTPARSRPSRDGGVATTILAAHDHLGRARAQVIEGPRGGRRLLFLTRGQWRRVGASGSGGVAAIAADARGRLAVASLLGAFMVRGGPGEEPVLVRARGDGQRPAGLALSRDGRWAARLTEACEVTVWDLRRGVTAPLDQQTAQDGLCQHVQFAAQSDRLLVSGAVGIGTWTVRAAGWERRLGIPHQRAGPARFSDDGRWLIAARPGRLTVWDARSGAELLHVPLAGSLVTAVAASPEADAIAAAIGTTDGLTALDVVPCVPCRATFATSDVRDRLARQDLTEAERRRLILPEAELGKTRS